MKNLFFLILMATTLALFNTGQANAQPTYVGTETCNNCHGKESAIGGNQWTTWVTSKHNMKWRDPEERYGVIPISAFTGNLDLAMNANFAVYDTLAPKLSYDNSDPADSTDESSGYRVTIGDSVYVVNYTLGGSGDWKQRYMTKIGNSIYILPIQYNEITDEWVTYQASDWYDSNNQPLTSIDPADSYERRCIGCHSVNPVVSYDTNTGEWTATQTERNIGCEACHGPGSDHASSLDPDDILNPATEITDLDRQLEACGACHGRGASQTATGPVGGEKTYGYPYNDAQGAFRPGDVLADFYTQTTSTKWPDAKQSKSHHQQYIDMLSSSHGDYDPSTPWIDLTCFTCHEPHDATTNKHGVRDEMVEDDITIAVKDEDNTFCLSCHATHGPFSQISVAMVADPTSANLDTITAVVETHTRHSYDPATGVSRCTSCHMAEVAKSAINYDISGHTWEAVGPEKTLNFQSSGGMPNSCAVSCHRAGDAGAPTYGIVDGSISNWTEASDVELANILLPFQGPGGYWWDSNTSGNNTGTLAAVRTTFLPTVDGDDSDPRWAFAPTLTLPNGTTMKATYDDQKIVILAKWADPTMSMTRGGSWQWESSQWVKTNATEEGGANEDRFNIMWNINVTGFEERGCATKCHAPEGNLVGAYLDTPGEYADMWHMKASRALPAISSSQSDSLTFSVTDTTDKHQVISGTITLNGYTDDKVVAARLDGAYPFSDEDGGRHGDSGSAMFRHNRNTAKTAPMYVETAPTNYIDGMVLYQSEIDNGEAVDVTTLSPTEVDAAWAAYAAVNAIVPERIMQTPAGSRGDVRQAAMWKDGWWTAEYERDLVTNNVDDVQFDDLTAEYAFGTASMDNSGGDAHDLSARLSVLRFEAAVSVDDLTAGLPGQYSLAQNHPNPFNPQTTIRYTLPKASHVELVVYDVLGRQVRRLVQGVQPAGYHTVVWNGRNSHGQMVASGLYFYRIASGSFSETKKMVLLK